MENKFKSLLFLALLPALLLSQTRTIKVAKEPFYLRDFYSLIDNDTSQVHAGMTQK